MELVPMVPLLEQQQVVVLECVARDIG